MRKLLEKQNKEELLKFIIEYAERDSAFANAIDVRFGKLVFDEELRKIENQIDDALSGASDYRRHNSWGHIIFNVGDIIEEIQQRAGQGHVRLAFSEIEMLYRKLLEIFEYQGECEVSDSAEYCLSVMSKIADKGNKENNTHQAGIISLQEQHLNYCLNISRIQQIMLVSANQVVKREKTISGIERQFFNCLLPVSIIIHSA